MVTGIREWVHGLFCPGECKICIVLKQMNNTIQKHITEEEKIKQKLKEKREKNGTEYKSI